MLKHLQTALLFSFLLTITGTAIAQSSDFPGACVGALQALAAANQTCLCSNTFDTRKTLLIPSLKHFGNLQLLGCDDGHEVNDFCGGITNTDCSGEECKYEIVISSDGSPVQTIVLDIGETVNLEAELRGPKCHDCTDRKKGCDKLDTSKLEAPLVWVVSDEDILEFSAVGGTAVVEAKASGIANVCAQSLELTYQNCVSVEVPGNIVDIVFVIETSIVMDFWIGIQEGNPGLKHHGRDIIAGVREHFSSESRVAIVTYNRPPVAPYNLVFPPADCSGEPSGEGFTAPAAAFTDHMEFRFTVDIPHSSDGFELLAVLCGGALDGDYVGAFVYSALMHAMEGSDDLGFWREEVNGREVPKIIVLIARFRPGGDFSLPYVNDPEPFTGFTRETVIQEAQQKDVEIHVFNVAPSLFVLEAAPPNRLEGSREVFTRIAQETEGTYLETEFSGSYPGEQLYQGIIDTMDKMGNRMDEMGN